MNQLHEIFDAKIGDIMTFDVETSANDVYLEAYTNGKLISIETNPLYQNLVVKFLNIEQCTNILICNYLCNVFSVNDEPTTYLDLPDSINQHSLTTSLYKTIRGMGILANVRIFDDHIVLSPKNAIAKPILDKSALSVIKGETVRIPINDNNDTARIRSGIHNRLKGTPIITFVEGGHLVISRKDTTDTVKPSYTHDTSAKSLFYIWVNNLEWDTPSDYLPAATTNDDYRHFSQLAGQNPLGCVKAKRGLFTKHSLCIAKDNGIVVVRYMGNIIYRTGSRSVKNITGNDVRGINLALSSLNKTYEDLV